MSVLVLVCTHTRELLSSGHTSTACVRYHVLGWVTYDSNMLLYPLSQTGGTALKPQTPRTVTIKETYDFAGEDVM